MFCRKFPAGTFLLLALIVCLAIPSMATTWTVSDLADDGTSGTLRYIIAEAASGDTIIFSVTGTITLTSGQLEISQSLTITGPGATSLFINGNYAGVNVFEIDSGATVSISGVTIENAAGGNGGSGIANSGTLTLTNSTVSGTGSEAPYGEGGINNSGTLTVTNSTISGNYGPNGGGINNSGTLTVTNSTFSGNNGFSPGGGGGIFNGSFGTATVTNSTFSGNSGGRSGHGSGGISNSGTLTVTNSTFSGNNGGGSGTAIGGGGISNGGTLTVSFSTFSGNSTSAPSGIGSGTVTVKSTLLANGSSGGNCSNSGTAFTSDGYNLSDDTSCTSFFTATGDNNDPTGGAGLSSSGLQNIGGPTDTIALLPTSPAVNAIPPADCTTVAGVLVTTDQRGVTRPQGSGCDIGAYELVQSIPFSALSAKLAATIGGPLPGFVLDVNFTLGASSTGITPLTQPVTLTVGTYSVTIPAGSFSELKDGTYYYLGKINKVGLLVTIVPLGGDRFSLIAAAGPVTLADSNPVSVTITIGEDTGNVAVTATFIKLPVPK